MRAASFGVRFKGSLATIDARNGYPYASLVTLATDVSGAPTLLISNLARHTANLAKRYSRLDPGRRDRRAGGSAARRARYGLPSIIGSIPGIVIS